MRPVRAMQLVAGMAIGHQSGGAELFGLELARRLNRDEFASMVFTMWEYRSGPEARWRAMLEGAGIPVRGLQPSGRSAVRDLPAIAKRLWSTVSELRPQIINSHSQRGDLLCLLVRWLHPLHPWAVRTVHIEQPWLNRPLLDPLFARGLFPLAFDAEVGVSEAVRRGLDRRLLARLRRRQAGLCYNGIDESLYESPGRPGSFDSPPPGIPEARPRLAVIGRLTPQKGHSVLLQALKLLLPKHPVHSLVIGSGPLEDGLRREADELGLRDSVHFLGGRDDVLEVLPHLDLLVSPSLWEGFATVLLEAMALGVPVVATDVSGSRELVRHDETGLLVPTSDPRALAAGIQELLSHPLKARRMAENARKAAAAFTLQRAAACHGELYRRLIRSH